jgi:hypothetical protein
MAAFAVIARFGRPDPHLTLDDRERDLDDDDLGGTPSEVPQPTAVEIRSSEPGRIAERLIRARELWTQTTFYLFDAGNWPG